MIPYADIDARLSAILNDNDRIRWPLEERLHWVNDAAGEIIILRPPAGAVTEQVALVAGVLQSIPEGGIQLLDVQRNIKADGTPGRPIGRTDRRLLDDADPEWYGRKQASTIKRFTYDDRNPKSFYVYPPAQAGVTVEILYSKPPAALTSEDDTLALDKVYIGPVVSYALYRALAKDSEYANGAVAAAHLQAFQSAMGIRNETSLAVGPKGAISETP